MLWRVPLICTKGFAYLRRCHDGFWTGRSAVRSVAWCRINKAVPSRPPSDMRRRATHLRSRSGASNTPSPGLPLRIVLPYIRCGDHLKSQLGNSGWYVAGKRRWYNPAAVSLACVAGGVRPGILSSSYQYLLYILLVFQHFDSLLINYQVHFTKNLKYISFLIELFESVRGVH